MNLMLFICLLLSVMFILMFGIAGIFYSVIIFIIFSIWYVLRNAKKNRYEKLLEDIEKDSIDKKVNIVDKIVLKTSYNDVVNLLGEPGRTIAEDESMEKKLWYLDDSKKYSVIITFKSGLVTSKELKGF